MISNNSGSRINIRGIVSPITDLITNLDFGKDSAEFNQNKFKQHEFKENNGNFLNQVNPEGGDPSATEENFNYFLNCAQDYHYNNSLNISLNISSKLNNLKLKYRGVKYSLKKKQSQIRRKFQLIS
jgi:hypothetical protein